MAEVGKGRVLTPGEIVTIKTHCDTTLGGRYRRDGDVFSFVAGGTEEDPHYLPLTVEEVGADEVADEIEQEPLVTPAGVDVNAPNDVKVRHALAALDPRDDEHWTRAGLPDVKAVDELCGGIGVTRDMIQAAQIDFTRPEVR